MVGASGTNVMSTAFTPNVRRRRATPEFRRQYALKPRELSSARSVDGAGGAGGLAREEVQAGRGYKGRREGYAERRSADDELLLARSQLMNKATITRSSGVNLGTVCQLWVDVDEWRVVSLDLRDNLLFGDLNCVLLRSLRQVRGGSLGLFPFSACRGCGRHGFHGGRRRLHLPLSDLLVLVLSPATGQI